MHAAWIKTVAFLTLLTVTGNAIAAAPEAAHSFPALLGIHRVVFLGDSITYAGQYVEYIETFVRTANPHLQCEFLDLGLPSETVSGLSEPGHAGGQFPRPNCASGWSVYSTRRSPILSSPATG